MELFDLLIKKIKRLVVNVYGAFTVLSVCITMILTESTKELSWYKDESIYLVGGGIAVLTLAFIKLCDVDKKQEEEK